MALSLRHAGGGDPDQVSVPGPPPTVRRGHRRTPGGIRAHRSGAHHRARYSTDFTPPAPGSTTYEFGEPLLFRLAAELFVPAGEDWNINLHPIGWAAWFGMLATGMNLLPIGQLDGGHVVYALLGRRGHRTVSFATLGGLVALGIWCFFGYLCFAVILVFMGLRHPPPSVQSGPLDRRRILAAAAGLLLLILTFIPTPVRVV